ncbi:MAG: serine hydrolase domain-containing protein [Gemmatimonadales bacterium]
MDRSSGLSRREFTIALGSAIAGAAIACRSATELDDLAELVEGWLPRSGSPGVAVARVVGEDLTWARGFGWADVAGERPMTADTIQNIGSISKTITATAVMQQWEAGKLGLDDDVNGLLPFAVRNPRFPDVPITPRQLLTHRSSITDGPAYGQSYACGDPAVALGAWIEGYFTEGGAYYDGEANFHQWAPGTADPPEPPRAYSNVAFGLLGYLVERLSGQPFDQYCRERIFAPLGMRASGWFTTEVDLARHAVTYSRLPDDFSLPAEGPLLLAAGVPESALVPGALVPHCLYSFYNYPDGLLRTSVTDLSRFLRAYSGGGSFEGGRILEQETVDLMLSDAHFGRGLCWSSSEIGGQLQWGHGGGDPGIATYMGFRPRDRVGAIVFCNFDSPEREGFQAVLSRLLTTT